MYNIINKDNFNDMILCSDKLIFKNIMELNKITEKKNLILTEIEVMNLIKTKNMILKNMGRIEIETGMLEKIIYEFYDSSYIDKDNYVEVLESLTNVFYLYQSELDNKLTDEQILKYLVKNFENTCNGSIELLESVALDNIKEQIVNGDLYE